MTYEKFYDIADYLNELTCWSFNNREVACWAYDYLVEYEDSIITPTRLMIEFCKDIVIGFDEIFDDYIDFDWDELTKKQLDNILERVLEEI